ncbi:MAG: dicarboxylate/amino acid:cation symporter [Flavobacteriales bacterium]
MKNIALHWKIIIGMIIGVVYGLMASEYSWINFTNDWIKPFGTIFINLLKLIAVPLILASLIKGVSSLSDISKLSRIGGKTIGIYLITTFIAVSFGLILVNVVQPGKSFSEEKRIELKEQFASNAALKIESAEGVQNSGPLQFLVDIVPNNIFQASSNNKNMLQVIFFAILFGIAMVMLPKQKVQTVQSFFDGVNDVILKIVDLIMLFSPYGVFALIAGLVVDFGGSLELFKALGIYSLTVVLGLLLMILLIYPLLLKAFTRIKYFDFFKGIAPAQMLAFSTSSSAATLPVTMERCEEHLGVSEEVSSFVLPLGATINMDGTSLYQSVAAVFIAQAFGYDLDLGQQMTIVLTATLASIGSAAVPGAGMVMLVIVLSSIGIDPEGIALIFAVDRILDMLRTVVNVTGDATVASVVASTEGQLREVTHEELMS